MPLTVPLKQLDNGPKRFHGRIPLAELELDTQDELIRAASDLEYEIKVERQDGNIFCSGALELTFEFECARCLKPFQHQTQIDPWNQLLALTGDDATAIDNDSIDLTPILREDMLLTLPQHPLCSSECEGIGTSTEEKPKTSNHQAETDSSASAWNALDQLRLE